jgi:8-oxo-dGTP diphosphatase
MKDGKVLIVRRVAGDFLGGNYELPGGGVDEGETFAEAVMREAKEETSLKVVAIEGMFDGFDYATDDEPKVRMFGFTVKTSDTKVRLSPAEHDDYAWIAGKEIDNYPMTPEMRGCLRILLAIPEQ